MTSTPFVFYVDPAWRKDAQHIPLLYPFWGNILESTRTPFQHALFERHQFDTTYYHLTDKPEEAHAVLMPYSHSTALRLFPDLVDICVKKAQELQVPLLLDGVGDVEHSFDVPNGYILRYGGYRSTRKGNEIFIPPYADDLLEIYHNGELQLRKKSGVPVVGFAGWASLPFKQEIRSIFKELPDRIRGIVDSRYRARKKGVFFRRQAVTILKNSPLVKTNFLVRTSYSGHVHTAEKSPEELRKEFVNNLEGSDYGLDIRGDANASQRLFEMLSLGRIPIIVDTDRNLPFSDKVTYSSFSLIVDFRDMYELPKRIADFHARLSEEEFENMQRLARDAFRNYFRVDALTKYIIGELRYKIENK